ncbi:MAG: hypothetical protein ACYCX8_12470, partial [Acidimicrobiales bacterium]
MAVLNLSVNPALQAALRRPCGLGPPFVLAMRLRPAGEVAEIARRLGVRVSGGADHVALAIAEMLVRPQIVERIVADGPPGTAEVARRIAAEGLVIETGYISPRDLGHLSHIPIGWLLGYGLLVPTSWGLAEMPREVTMALRDGRLVSSFSP